MRRVLVGSAWVGWGGVGWGGVGWGGVGLFWVWGGFGLVFDHVGASAGTDDLIVVEDGERIRGAALAEVSRRLCVIFVVFVDLVMRWSGRFLFGSVCVIGGVAQRAGFGFSFGLGWFRFVSFRFVSFRFVSFDLVLFDLGWVGLGSIGFFCFSVATVSAFR